MIDGRRIQSVTAGLWGGGLWSAASDDARIGILLLARGVWCGHRILSDSWVRAMFTASGVNENYGYLWWLNTEGRIFPEAPSTGVWALGGDRWQMIWIDPAAQLVVVSRWSADQNGLQARIYDALPANPKSGST
jgi:CubicO group peptidase (beta-lactamase class C family)